MRSDGATCEAVRRRAPDRQQITVRTIRDPARRAMIGIDESTRSLITFGLYPDEARGLRLPRAACPPGVPELTVTILGYRTQHVRFEVPRTECEAGPGFIRRTLDKWVSPELGCLPLRVEHGFIAGDGRALVSSVREAKAVVLGEPDGALFQSPNYPERSLSQVIREFERKYGLAPLEKPFADLEFHDRRYEESRKQLGRGR